MNAFFSTIRRTVSRTSKLTTITLALLPVVTGSVLPLSAQAASGAVDTLPATTISATEPTDLYALSSASLVGTWQATDAAVLQMLDALYSPGGAAPEAFTGGIYLTADEAGGLTIRYDELQMIFPASSGIPPVTLRGTVALSWVESAPSVVSMTGQSHNIEAEVLGMVMPGSLFDVEMDTTPVAFDVVNERLSFLDLPASIYLPTTWLRAY